MSTMNLTSTTLQDKYEMAADAALLAGVTVDDERGLIRWIRRHCSYRPGTEFFLVLGIGAALARLEIKGGDPEPHFKLMRQKALW